MALESFELNEVLSDSKIIEEVDTFGDKWRHKERRITDDVILLVFESGHAALEISSNTAIEFNYTDEVAEMFDRINEVKAIELLEVLKRNEI